MATEYRLSYTASEIDEKLRKIDDLATKQQVELDTTLTQSGKAADAKAVGDKLAELTGISLVEPAEDDMPKVFLTGSEFGNMTTQKNEVKMGLEYISKTDKFKAAIKIKFQGNTSLTFPKKNFTIKMYTDETYENKLKKTFKDWGYNSNKYVLKANWIDHSHARNIISARLWGEVVESRPDYDTLPDELRNSPRNGAIDGFPIKLYINGIYEGVYTWNVGKDDWMWGMDEDNANHVLMCAETNNDGVIKNTPCNFRTLWSGTDENNWTVEVGTNSDAVKTALNNLIQFVMDNDGDAFRNGIDNYLDIQSAIDYYIFQYEICGLDGLAKNMLLATYDGARWICGAYDMDATFGLYWNGSKFVSTQYRCPEDYQETYSLLWERIEANFLPELKARQSELRKTVLSYSNMVTHFERFMDVIGLDLYAEDLTIYTGIPSGSTNNIKQIRSYIRDRQAYVDAEFAAMTGGAAEPDEPDIPDEPDEPVVPGDGLLYNLPEVTTFDGTNYIDTGVRLFAENKPFTLALDWEHTGESEFKGNSHTVVCCIHEVSPWPGMCIQYVDGGISIDINQGSATAYCSGQHGGQHRDYILKDNLRRARVVVVKDSQGNITVARSYNNSDTIFTNTHSKTFVGITESLLLGCHQNASGGKFRYAKGIMHDCKVYDHALSTEEIEAYLTAPDSGYNHGIASTGTQYIDTGIIPTPNTAVEVSYRNAISNSTYETLFGTSPNGMAITYSNIDGFEMRFCGNYLDNVKVAVIGTDTVLRLDGLNKKLTVDGVDVTPDTFDWDGTGRATDNMLLFTKYHNGELDTASGTFILYYFKVWENGELIQHLVPHIDEEGVVCLYDEVSGECFYNQGTGEFAYV